MLNKANGLAALALIVVVGSGCIFSTSSTTIRGVVMNYDVPVEGAEVTFGPTLGEVTAVTGKDGRFTLTAKHRPTAMLRVTVKKDGFAQREKVEFPGFAAPDEEVKVEMLKTIPRTR